jgi:hypothetical protein
MVHTDGGEVLREISKTTILAALAEIKDSLAPAWRSAKKADLPVIA